MTTKTIRNKTVVRRLFDEVWNRGDMAAASEVLASPEGVQSYVAGFRAAFPDVQHEIQEMIAEDDAVVVTWSARATHTGAWLGLPPTAKTVDWKGVTVAHLVDDLIIDHDTNWDLLGFAVQLGAIPERTWLPLAS